MKFAKTKQHINIHARAIDTPHIHKKSCCRFADTCRLIHNLSLETFNSLAKSSISSGRNWHCFSVIFLVFRIVFMLFIYRENIEYSYRTSAANAMPENWWILSSILLISVENQNDWHQLENISEAFSPLGSTDCNRWVKLSLNAIQFTYWKVRLCLPV